MIDDELRRAQRARADEVDERFLTTLARAGRLPRVLCDRLVHLRLPAAIALHVEDGGVAPPDEVDVPEWLKAIAAWSPEAALRLTEAALADYFEERIPNSGFRGMDGPAEVFVRGLEAIDRWIVEPGTAARFEVEAARDMVVAIQTDPEAPWEWAGPANIIGRALLVITEPALAVEHAVSAGLDCCAQVREPEPREFLRGVRDRLVPWLLEAGDPVRDRRGVFGAHLGAERGIVRSLSFDAAGGRLLVTTGEGRRAVWDVAARRRLRELPPAVNPRRDLFCGALTSDGSLALTLDGHGRLCCFDVETGAELWAIETKEPTKDGQPCGLELLDDRRALSAHHSGVLCIWPVHREAPVAPLRVLEGEESWVRGLAVSPDRRAAVTRPQRGGLVRRWDLEAGRCTGALETDLGDEGVADVAYTADGARVVATMDRDKVVVWDERRGERLAVHTLPGVSRGSSSCTCLATSPEGRRLAVGRDRIVDLLDADTGASLQRTRVLGLPLALGWSRTGALIVGMRGGALRTV